MKVRKKTTIKYTLDEKELSKIVLKSMKIHEVLVDSIVFITDSVGLCCDEGSGLSMEITMSYDDSSEPQE